MRLLAFPGRVHFSFEGRSQSRATLDVFYVAFIEECRRIEEARGVQFQADRRLDTEAAIMDSCFIDRLRAVVRRLELPDHPIPSGAGHDAAVFANVGVPSAMVFVRNQNGSHNPREGMTMEDFMLGAEVLRLGLLEGAA
jgi:N-carbamoyl-L-amino-acid hydrolase